MKLISDSRERTLETGRLIGGILERGDVVALSGELGSGKTCLTQGMAKGLGVADNVPVVSPTFTLINEYPGGRVPLFHLDVYRLSGCRDLEDMGYEEYFYGGGTIVIEWAEKIREILPANTLFVSMRYIDENTREMTVEGPRDKIQKLEELLNANSSHQAARI
ncbi:MAG TPA: tRNA (adenosine(37)-N6)-threonylcarbamoyltransferase complex ATPase subunit type 1 TsaE [Syntrophales bacterium]|nr:tRNA (adenosine(37)-N6)-threonylcarbamoyltransferase complex ATPase subunit type 1 TsaE [Syntrophales bacterium]